MSRSVQKRQNSRGATRSRVAARNERSEKLKGALVRVFRSLLVMVFVLLSGFGLYKAAPHINPEIEKVAVTGNLIRLDQELMSKVVQENLSGGILTLDIEYLRSQILRTPWVEQVQIIKQFPDTLVVNIVEETAIAQWNNGGYISYLGEYIQSPLYEDLNGLPKLSSALRYQEQGAGAREAIELFHLLNSVVLTSEQNILELRQSSVGGWSMVWNNGLSVDLGRADHLNRTKHVMAAWQRLPLDVKTEIDRIDARYDNGVAIRSDQQTNELSSTIDKGSELIESLLGKNPV